jgi:predicted esterase
MRRLLLFVFLAIPVLQDKPQSKPEAPKEDEDIADVPSQDLRCGKNEKQRYFRIGPRKDVKPPKEGFGLLVVLPGGGGTADFLGFVKRIAKHAAGDKYLVVQPVAVMWVKSQETVWPTKMNSVPSMQFSTEEFVEAVIAETSKQQKIDPKKIFTLSWSSSGPAAYAISLREKTPVRGSFIAMSVFVPTLLPPLGAAKAKPYYLLHSPSDEVCKFSFAEDAKKQLEKAGASVELVKYEGGHGWHGPVYPMIRKGLDWLEIAK